jgi:hypothetical protein
MREDAKLRSNRKDEVEAVRPKRVPLHGRRVLSIDFEEPGYHYAWVSDSDLMPGGIKKFLDAGYEFVKEPTKVGESTVNDSGNIGSTVSRNGGQGVTLHLMRIPEEYYNEDNQLMEDERLAQEAQILTPDFDAGQYGKK